MTINENDLTNARTAWGECMIAIIHSPQAVRAFVKSFSFIVIGYVLFHIYKNDYSFNTINDKINKTRHI